MLVFRRRLIYWLIREYISKWGKALLLSFVIGLSFFLLVLGNIKFIIAHIPAVEKDTIGIVGVYTVESLPPVVLSKLSRGLTLVESGNVKPDVARSWQITNEGKTYIFNLKDRVYFADGQQLTSETFSYNFADVKFKKIDKLTIAFELSETYAPFLVTVSRPILRKGFTGIGEYRIKDVKLNGNFVEKITLGSVKNPLKSITYKFYPNMETLKTAFVLGEINQALGLSNTNILKKSLNQFSNVIVQKHINFKRIVTLFFNTKDSLLSSRDMRLALSYSLPDIFSDGQRSYTLYPPSSIAYTNQYDYSQDIKNARILADSNNTATDGGKIRLLIKTLPKYKQTAQIISEQWKKIGVESSVEAVDTIPSDFQIFLGDFHVPDDPDQYLLWHSGHDTNITGYENKRIDKLLEDGRKKVDMEERKKIYLDFQKYLIADSPAAFLYFPNEYNVTRK